MSKEITPDLSADQLVVVERFGFDKPEHPDSPHQDPKYWAELVKARNRITELEGELADVSALAEVRAALAAVQQPNREALAVRTAKAMADHLRTVANEGPYDAAYVDAEDLRETIIDGRVDLIALAAVALPIPATGEATEHRCEFYPHRDVMQCVCGNREVTP